MQTIKRDIYVTKNVLQAPIEVTEGTNSIAIEFDVRDYEIPASAAAVAYSLSTSSMEEPNKALADVSGNKITIIPSEAFFLPGQNVMQIRIIDGNSKLISFNIIVKCTGKMRFGDEKEEQQSTLVEQMLAKLGEYQKKSASPYNFKGSCLSSELPASGNTINDTYYCTDLKYRKTWNGSAWEQSSLNEADYEDELTKTNGEVSSLKEDVNNLEDVVIIEENLIDYSNKTDGKYYSSKFLNTTDFNGLSIFPKIDLNSNTYYTIGAEILNQTSGNFSWVSQTGQDRKTFLDYLNDTEHITNDDGSVTLKTTATTENIYLTLGTTNTPTTMLVKGKIYPTSFIPYGEKKTEIKGFNKNNLTNIYVDLNYSKTDNGFGSTKFNKLSDAVNSIKNSNENNIYNVYINSGEYDLFNEFGGNSWFSTLDPSKGERQGLVLPDYVNLIGLGNPTIKLIVDASYLTGHEDNTRLISTINMWKHNRLENLTILASNTRYAIHCESNNNYDNTHIVVKNCHVVQQGNSWWIEGVWKNSQAFGGGTGSGAIIKAIDSEFISENTQGFRLHTNSNQKSNTLICDGCYFKGAKNQVGIGVSSYGTNSEQGKWIYKNCISVPINDIQAGLETPESVQTWNVYDYVNNVVHLID